jgi:hypothetical protein
VGVSGESDWVGLGDSGGDEEEESGEMVSLDDGDDELEAGITWTLDEAVDGSRLFPASSKQSQRAGQFVL